MLEYVIVVLVVIVITAMLLRKKRSEHLSPRHYDLLPAGSNDHTHTAALNEDGDGESSVDSGHSHTIQGFTDTAVIGDAPPHVHEVVPRQVALRADEPRRVSFAEPAP